MDELVVLRTGVSGDYISDEMAFVALKLQRSDGSGSDHRDETWT